MPHSSLHHEQISTSGITLSASMKYFSEKKSCVGFFFTERMLNETMNLGQTFVCLRGLPHWIATTGEGLLFPQKPNKLQINITVATIWLLCSLLYICASHPTHQVQMCFFQVGEVKDIITTQPIMHLKEEGVFQYSSQSTKSSSE